MFVETALGACFFKICQKSALAENVSSSCFYTSAYLLSLWMKSFIMLVICKGSSLSLFIIFNSTVFIRLSFDFFFHSEAFISCAFVWDFICLA